MDLMTRLGTRKALGARLLMGFVLSICSLVVTGPVSNAYPRPGTNVLITTAYMTDQPSQGEAFGSAITPSGRYVAFTAYADDLVKNERVPDPRRALLKKPADVYMHDHKTMMNHLISVSSTGERGVPDVLSGGGAVMGSVSASGRYVAFASDYINLVAGDTNMAWDVFVRDRELGTTERVSVASDGAQSGLEQDSGSPVTPAVISANGRFVAFLSNAANLVSGDENSTADLFVHDRMTGETKLVTEGDWFSGPSCGAQPTSTLPVLALYPCKLDDTIAISADGKVVAYTIEPDPAVGGLSLIGHSTVWVRDLNTGEAKRADIKSDGTPGRDSLGVGLAGRNALSADGRYVIFLATAAYVPAKTTTGTEIYRHDFQTGRTQRVTVTSRGEEREGHANQPGGGEVHLGSSLSLDGRYVAMAVSEKRFDRSSDEVEPECILEAVRCSKPQIYVHDMDTGSTELISVDDPRRHGANGFYTGSRAPSITPDGRFLAFVSRDSVAADDDPSAEPRWHVYLHDRGPKVGVGNSREPKPQQPQDPNEDICIGDVCIPPLGFVASIDATSETVGGRQGADLHGASLAYRPPYEDLFAAIELEHMPTVVPGPSPIFYGLRFQVEDKSYEVRATSFLGGTFGLFECSSGSPSCVKVADLRGGYGTTGERVVLSLPLDAIGLEGGGELSEVEAYSAFGSYFTGPAKILDTVRIQ